MSSIISRLRVSEWSPSGLAQVTVPTTHLSNLLALHNHHFFFVSRARRARVLLDHSILICNHSPTLPASLH